MFGTFISLEQALRVCYPDFPWDSSNFLRATPKYWGDLASHRQNLDKIGKELGVKKVTEIYLLNDLD